MPYAPKRYTHAQLISYETATLGIAPPGNVAAVTGGVKFPQGSPDYNDLGMRMKRLYKVVEFAATTFRAQTASPATLKIFMAPEFYFRPPLQNFSSYSHNSLQEGAACLRSMFSAPIFKDWLIVGGTIFSSLPAGMIDLTQKQRAFTNTAVVVKGGAPDAPFHFVHKKMVSGIDGAPSNQAGLFNPNFFKFLMSWDELKQNIFKIDNVTFGLEVCLDHAAGAKRTPQLKQMLNDWRGKEKTPLPVIDIHLLTACGMPVIPGSVGAKVGGHIMRCDGHPAGVSSTLNRVQTQNIAIGGVATLTPVNHVAQAPIPAPLQVPQTPAQRLYLETPQGNGFAQADTASLNKPQRLTLFSQVTV